MMRASTLTPIALLLVVFGSRRVRADDADLAWSAPSGCPPRSYVERRVRSLVARADALRPKLKVDAHVRRTPAGRYQLQLSMHAEDYAAARKLDAASCTSLADAAAFLIAVALAPDLSLDREDGESSSEVSTSEPPSSSASPPLRADSMGQPNAGASSVNAALGPDGVAEAQSPRGSPPARTQAESEIEPTPRPVRTDDREAPNRAAEAQAATKELDRKAAPPLRSRTRFRDVGTFRVGAFVGLFDAALPGPQAALGAGAGLGFRALLAELRVSWIFRSTRDFSAGPRVHVQGQELSAALCGQWGKVVQAGPCLVGALLRASGSVSGATEMRQDSLLWAALGPSLQFGFEPLRSLGLSLELGTYFPVTARPLFTVEGAGDVGPARAVTVYARAGVGFRRQAAKKRE